MRGSFSPKEGSQGLKLAVLVGALVHVLAAAARLVKTVQKAVLVPRQRLQAATAGAHPQVTVVLHSEEAVAFLLDAGVDGAGAGAAGH